MGYSPHKEMLLVLILKCKPFDIRSLQNLFTLFTGLINMTFIYKDKILY